MKNMKSNMKNSYLFISTIKINKNHKTCLNNLYQPIICQYRTDYSFSAVEENEQNKEKERENEYYFSGERAGCLLS